MSNLTAKINEQTIFTKKDGTSFNLDELNLRELCDLIRDDESKDYRQIILDVYNKKLAKIADAYLKSQGVEL